MCVSYIQVRTSLLLDDTMEGGRTWKKKRKERRKENEKKKEGGAAGMVPSVLETNRVLAWFSGPATYICIERFIHGERERFTFS